MSQNMVSFSEPSVSQTLDLRSIKHFRNPRLSCSTYDSLDWLGFLDKSNLLKIADFRSFIVLKTLTGYRPYSNSVAFIFSLFSDYLLFSSQKEAKRSK